jgi:hypothetical protein
MKHIVSVALAAGFVCASVPAGAENLIVNPNFDSDVSGWQADASGTRFWHDPQEDAGGAANSGALAMSTADGRNARLSVQQCIAVNGGRDFSFGVQIKPRSSDLYGMTCSAYAAADCSGTALESRDAVAGATNGGGWIAFRSEAPFMLPAETNSVLCAVTAQQPLRVATQPNGFINALWADDAFFAPGTTPVSLQQFEVL